MDVVLLLGDQPPTSADARYWVAIQKLRLNYDVEGNPNIYYTCTPIMVTRFKQIPQQQQFFDPTLCSAHADQSPAPVTKTSL